MKVSIRPQSHDWGNYLGLKRKSHQSFVRLTNMYVTWRTAENKHGRANFFDFSTRFSSGEQLPPQRRLTVQLQGVVDRREWPRSQETPFKRMRSHQDRMANRVDQPLFLTPVFAPEDENEMTRLLAENAEDGIGERLPALALMRFRFAFAHRQNAVEQQPPAAPMTQDARWSAANNRDRGAVPQRDRERLRTPLLAGEWRKPNRRLARRWLAVRRREGRLALLEAASDGKR